MNARILLLTICVGLATVAGAVPQAAPPPVGGKGQVGDSAANACRDAHCVVTVTASGCAPTAISASPDPYYVGPGNRAVMRFQIDPKAHAAGWSFADSNGIVFKGEAAGEFVLLTGSSPTEYLFLNRHRPTTSPGGVPGEVKHEYGINIARRSAAGGVIETCPVKDPWIFNM